MDQGGVFVILFKMVRYHQKKYPSYIPLHLEEVAGHFDVKRVPSIQNIVMENGLFRVN